jgi:hypothetical protein
MIEDQKLVLHWYAGLLAGFVFGFWRGLSLLQLEMEERRAAELDRLTSSLLGMQPLGQACIFSIIGGWLFVRVCENNKEKVTTECAEY